MAVVAHDVLSKIFGSAWKGKEIRFTKCGILEPCTIPQRCTLLTSDPTTAQDHWSSSSGTPASHRTAESAATSRSCSTPASSNATPKSITDELTNVPDPNDIRKLLLSNGSDKTKNGTSLSEKVSSAGANDKPAPPPRIIGPQLPPTKLIKKENGNGIPQTSRKRFLSERGEEEARFPVIDEKICTDGWKGLSVVQGRVSGVGLHNPGNDCFMNAVLQAFVHTAQVVRFLFSHNQPNNCSSMCLMCGLRTHAIRAVTGSGPQTSSWLNKHLRRIFPSHYEGHQEDAHELLTLLLGALDPLPPKQPNGMPKLPNRTSTPIEQIFGGTLRNQVKCQVCCTVHTNYERIREINLGLRLRIQEGNTSMSKLISDFFQPEQIKDFSCKKCNRKVSAVRSTCILRAPLVLIVQLKRFTTFGGKIKLPVTSEEQINLAPYHHSREETGYRLNGVIEHIGNGVNSGHYVAAMRGFDEQSWYFFDDDVKGKVSLQRVQAMLPYIVFYTRMRKNGPSPAVNGNQTNGSALGKRPASILDNLTPKTTQSSYSSTSYFMSSTINNYKKARIS